MPFITFFYRIGNNSKKYYGKYVCRYISDDHEGLDAEIKPTVVDGINKFRKQEGFPELSEPISIGVLSFSSHEYIPMDSTDEEINCFDFYYERSSYQEKTFVNGKRVI